MQVSTVVSSVKVTENVLTVLAAVSIKAPLLLRPTGHATSGGLHEIVWEEGGREEETDTRRRVTPWDLSLSLSLSCSTHVGKSHVTGPHR